MEEFAIAISLRLSLMKTSASAFLHAAREQLRYSAGPNCLLSLSPFSYGRTTVPPFFHLRTQLRWNRRGRCSGHFATLRQERQLVGRLRERPGHDVQCNIDVGLSGHRRLQYSICGLPRTSSVGGGGPHAGETNHHTRTHTHVLHTRDHGSVYCSRQTSVHDKAGDEVMQTLAPSRL